MSTIVRSAVVGVVAAVALLISCTAITHVFWVRCGRLDVHAWPQNLICWYTPELIALAAMLIGVAGGYFAGRKAALPLALSAVGALAAFRLQGGFPFGHEPNSFLVYGFLYLMCPFMAAGLAASRVKQWGAKNGL